jgi:hypothetical protein
MWKELKYRCNILDLGMRWRWVVSFTLDFTPREGAPGSHWMGGWVSPRNSLECCGEEKNLAVTGIEAQPSSPRACYYTDWAVLAPLNTESKMKIMAFRGREQKRNTVYVNYRMLDQINGYNCYGYDISCKKEKNMNVMKWQDCEFYKQQKIQKKLGNLEMHQHYLAILTTTFFLLLTAPHVLK